MPTASDGGGEMALPAILALSSRHLSHIFPPILPHPAATWRRGQPHPEIEIPARGNHRTHHGIPTIRSRYPLSSIIQQANNVAYLLPSIALVKGVGLNDQQGRRKWILMKEVKSDFAK